MQKSLQKNYPNLVWRFNYQNKGFAYGMNNGIKLSNGEFIVIQNPDSKIINNKLSNYKDSDSEKNISLTINSDLKREISSKDTKGNAKTYRIEVNSQIVVKDSSGNVKEKLFSKSLNYNNQPNKFELKNFEKETTKNLSEKISQEIIIYLQSF